MNGLLVCSPWSKEKNIGDYIQSVAQEQFFTQIDCYVEREKLNTFRSAERTKVIMNAWFMWHPENFPPSKDIIPFFISFHVVPNIANRLLTPNTINYLKKHEPIGARDFATQKLLEKHGIKSYFSGCLTLTLGLNYCSAQKNDTIYFVDPYYTMSGMKPNRLNVREYLRTLFYFFKYRNKIQSVLPHFVHEYKTIYRFISTKLENRLCAAVFYRYYHEICSDDMLKAAKFVKHTVDVQPGMDNNYLMYYAKELLKEYSKANLVITSRIHCALPCLGLETPTIFVTSDVLEGDKLRSKGRFGGLIELLHVVKWTPNGIISQSSEINEILKKGKITSSTVLKNKTDYLSLKQKLIEKVESFVKNV